MLLDYRPALFGRGGIATYARELVAGLARVRPDDALLLWAHRFRRPPRDPDFSPPPGARLYAGRLPSQAASFLARLGIGVDRLVGGVDVVHWTDYVASPLPAPGRPVVATIHDVLFEELPGAYTPAMRRGLRAVTTRIVRRAERLLVPSARSRDALIAFYGARPERVDVIPHGVRPLPAAPPAREYGRYVLFVGTLEPRKNLARLLEAHARLDRVGAGFGLVVAGPRGWMDDGLVAAMGRSAGVVWEEDVRPARLASLYRGALALAYPSLGEGFGLPVLEAMAEGVAVIVGEDTACADLAGDVALAVNPRSVDALAGALEALANDDALRRTLAARGRERAKAFTWERAARATWRSYERALSS